MQSVDSRPADYDCRLQYYHYYYYHEYCTPQVRFAEKQIRNFILGSEQSKEAIGSTTMLFFCSPGVYTICTS